MKVTVIRNEQLNGIELVYPAKPVESVRAEMSTFGFRWHRFKKLWYARFTPDRWTFAEHLSTLDIQEDDAPVSYRPRYRRQRYYRRSFDYDM